LRCPTVDRLHPRSGCLAGAVVDGLAATAGVARGPTIHPHGHGYGSAPGPSTTASAGEGTVTVVAGLDAYLGVSVQQSRRSILYET
jgi:hypothetical protein